MKDIEVIEKFLAHYKYALDNEFIAKPLSYALYHTWKYCDSHEKPRTKTVEDTDVKRICGNCEYLDMNIKSSVGYQCNRPDWSFRTRSAHWKEKNCKACKDFKLKEEKNE